MSAHGRTHWIKLYVEMLDDPKVGLLPDAVKWRWVSSLLLAGELNEDGYLPDINDAAWRLHTNVETLQGEMRTLAGRGLVELREHPDGGERWFIPAFVKRQEAATSTERSRNLRHRRRQNGDETPVQRNVAFSSHNTETETETETEGEKNAHARASRQQVAAPASPPPRIVTHYIPDLTPEPLGAEYGYRPPAEPTPQPKGPPSPEIVAIGEMANAITDVTGVSAKLNREAMFEFASSLVAAGYTPEQVRTHYTRDASPGRWNWYTHDWRGRDKGDMPRLKELRETIAGATATNSPTQQKKMGAIEKALAMFGNAPSPATAS